MGAALGVAGAVLGGIAGGEGSGGESSGSTVSNRKVFLPGQQIEEKEGNRAALESLTNLEKQLADIQNMPVQARFQSLLQELGSSPSEARIQEAQQFASQIFQPQQVALQQSLEDQQRQFAGRAAQLGRSTADPILAARLAQEQVRQQQALSAQQGAFAAQESINAPQRQFQNLATGISSLNQQAIQNQSAIFSLGSTLAERLQGLRQFQANIVETGTSQGSGRSGGGFGGALGGVLAGAGAGVKIGQNAGLFSSDNSLKVGSPIATGGFQSAAQNPFRFIA